MSFFSVSKEIKPSKYSSTEGSYQGKWSAVFCVRIYEGKFIPVNERQVSK